MTADDLGLSAEINRGIIDSHRNGLVTSASLLANAPATDEAIELSRTVPELEVGIHLSLVEGLALRGRPSSITDSIRYFDDRLCLIRHWKVFVRKWLQGSIRPDDVETELDLQIRYVKQHFPTIPFANATQHLHLLPGVRSIVLRLCARHGISRLRIPWQRSPEPMAPLRRLAATTLVLLGRGMKRRAEELGIESPTHFLGFGHSGAMRLETLTRVLDALPDGIVELMVHPGYESPDLRKRLPWAYREFDWEGELGAVTSTVARHIVDQRGVRLSSFREAFSGSGGTLGSRDPEMA